jgi:signal transduction histidine kinase
LDEVIHIEADLFMTKTILINLIENALKYAGTNEKLTLFLHKDNLNSKFGVKDVGPGISKDAQADIFKKFVRLENEETRSQKGTGLGLSLCYDIVTKEHQGMMSVQSEEGSFTQFTIQLPI